MSDDERVEPLQLGKRTLDVIIEGVASGRARPKSGLTLSPTLQAKAKVRKKVDRFISPYSTRLGVKLLRGECTATRRWAVSSCCPGARAAARAGRGAVAPPGARSGKGCSGPPICLACTKVEQRPANMPGAHKRGAVAPPGTRSGKGVQWPANMPGTRKGGAVVPVSLAQVQLRWGSSTPSQHGHITTS